MNAIPDGSELGGDQPAVLKEDTDVAVTSAAVAPVALATVTIAPTARTALAFVLHLFMFPTPGVVHLAVRFVLRFTGVQCRRMATTWRTRSRTS
jgi:hypothetical protein